MNSQKLDHHVPVSFSAVYRVRPGAEPSVPALLDDYVTAVRSAGHGTISVSAGVSEDGSRLAIAALHPSTQAAEAHLIAVSPFISRSFELAELESVIVLGTPGPLLEAALTANAEAGATVTTASCRKGFVAVPPSER
ncbi:hypothetical protein GE115_10515 [Agromyces sp. CFH 90414]|uniref:Uncharacterized protein n=1 Tax=Agromyces agglutinans TaxID=2662258 RepID=A0A6I2F481_9MICO|nr:hypothetical protein [Agromyces agglutinans]MRG60295.1 hypothetical protein [Agromyces agglutinans]